MKWLALILLVISAKSFAQMNMSFAMRGYPTLRCQPTTLSSWVPQANSLKAIYHLNGTGTITNGSVVASEIALANATATNSSATLAFADHPGAPNGIAFLRNYLTASGNANDSISTSATSLANLPAATWNFWVNMSIPSSTAIRLFYKSDNNSSAGYYLTLNPSGSFDFRKVHSVTNMVVQTCPIATSFNNTWRMITVTWDGTSNANGVKIYMNGFELITTGSGSVYLSSPGTCPNAGTYGGYTYQTAGVGGFTSDAAYPFYLVGAPSGTNTTPTSIAFSGSMDEFAVWNKELTSTEVFMLYRNQKCN
ncbi:LamG domain-containing protein [Bdellovibrio sp. KM01]|uniref:LamG domain-containing protein n=1 Tax=Bdellovibrio sp. KM01 TaxID=2748865 RepID=UPI0015EAA0F4|nr:LamG domain-containing protein [Bdellovibrio sp. KM01]QLY26595.1 LamG domain-containing protein [Bdellovibrio sp. KM01]